MKRSRRLVPILIVLVLAVSYTLFGLVPQYYGCLNRGGVPVEAPGYWACAEVKR